MIQTSFRDKEASNDGLSNTTTPSSPTGQGRPTQEQMLKDMWMTAEEYAQAMPEDNRQKEIDEAARIMWGWYLERKSGGSNPGEGNSDAVQEGISDKDTTWSPALWQWTEEENISNAPWLFNSVQRSWEDTETPISTDSEESDRSGQGNISDISSFKENWWSINDLEELIENRYGTNATIKWDTVIAEINGEQVEWKIDSEWSPIKTSLWRTDNPQYQFGIANWIDTELVNWSAVLSPKTVDEALDIYAEFWENYNISQESLESIKWLTAYKYLNKFKWASSSALLSWLKNNEIWVGWETWDRLTRLNWWVETPEMIAARGLFEDEIKISEINHSSQVLLNDTNVSDIDEALWNTPEPQPSSESISEEIRQIDAQFQDEIKKYFADISVSFEDYKANNEELGTLNSNITETANKIDELREKKRDIWKEIRERHPGMDYSGQIQLYNQRAEDFDDQIFALEREYNQYTSDYNYKNQQAQSEYEFRLKTSETKFGFIQDLYGIKRWDLKDLSAEERANDRQDELIELSNEREDVIYERDIARQDKLISDNIALAEKQRIQAIADWDTERAKEQEYSIKLLEEQLKLNQKYGDNIKLLWGSAYLERNAETLEWELKSADNWSWVSTWIGSSQSGEIISNHWSASEWLWNWWTPTWKWWAYDGFAWVDYDLEVWDPVTAPFDLHIVSVEDQWDKDFGKTVLAEDVSGNRYRFSHLDNFNVAIWDSIKKWQLIWPGWNTWNVRDINWNIPTKEQLAKWVWSHLDFVSYTPDWRKRTADETIQHMNSLPSDYGKFPESVWWVNTDGLPTWNPWDIDEDSIPQSSDAFVEIFTDSKWETANVVLGSIWVPIAFERTIKNQIPATLLNSEVELAAANDVIKNLHASWIPKEQASAIFQWFEIDSADDIQLWANALKIIRSLNVPPEWILARISANINTWWESNAIAQLERAAEWELWEDIQTKAQTRIQINRLNSIKNYIEEQGWPGVIGWKIESFKWKFKEEDISRLEALLWTYSTEKVAEIFWTSVTWWEADNAWAITLSLDEKVQALYNKIDVFKQDELQQLNAYRLWTLPVLNEDQVLDHSLLSQAYRSENLFWTPWVQQTRSRADDFFDDDSSSGWSENDDFFDSITK